MTNDEEFLAFDVVLYGPINTIDGHYACASVHNHPAPPANDPEYGPQDAA